MIQSNELRIGNWVYDIDGGFCQIEELPALFGSGFRWGWLKNINPISLTPEILKKAGFKYDEGMESYDLFLIPNGLISIATDCSFFIGHNHLECGFAGGNKSLVKYVHQLQNLYFALTGEELQIDL